MLPAAALGYRAEPGLAGACGAAPLPRAFAFPAPGHRC